MRIALAQYNYTIGDIENNKRLIIDGIHKAKEQKADCVVFAEFAVSGTPALDLLGKTTFLELCEDALEEIASHTDSITAIVGSPVLESDGSHSAAVVMTDGKICEVVTKQNLTARREMGFITNGSGPKILKIAGEYIAVVVGEDFSSLQHLSDDVRFILNVNARRYGKGTFSARYETFSNYAKRDLKSIIMINQIGGSGEIVYDGTSSVITQEGHATLIMKSFEEDFAVYNTDACNEPIEVPEQIFIHDRAKMNFDAAVLGLRDYYHKNGYQKALVGLSGGIDSSIVTCIAVEALGKENVRTLTLPSQFTPEQSVADAVNLASTLGIRYDVIPINEAYSSIIGSMTPVIGATEFDLTEENIQARIRTTMLMALQNKTGYMLLNCSNKSENALGLCTLYGDTAGAFSPTGDLYKTEMYEMASHINRRFNNIIPESILLKAPSSELSPNQKDTDLFPSYEIVDAILIRMIEQSQHREEIINAGFDSQIVEKIHSLLMQNEKKRFQFPPVLRLSSRAFRHELLMPLINKYSY
ncbi:MAG: NAD+ synthase [Alistipes sp.]|nr:NAD+ synthase [Candidatus Alistipes equi]